MAGPLARRYRRLLCCYPRAHRRDELLDTLLEAAPPQRTRPTARETANLIRHGLRARLGRPASRTVATWAVLATVTSGLFGAAAGSWIGWHTTEPPNATQVRAILTEILPDQKFRHIDDTPDKEMIYFYYFFLPIGWDVADNFLLGEGIPTQSPRETLDLTRQRLRNTGWTVYQPVVGGESVKLHAERGHTRVIVSLLVSGNVSWSRTTSQPVGACVTRTTPSAVYPLAITGGLASATIAFFLFAWASHRTTRRHPARGAVTALFGVTMFLWCAPTVFMLPHTVQANLAAPHPSWWSPMWEWLGQPTFSLLFLAGGCCALLSLALAARTHTNTETAATPAPS